MMKLMSCRKRQFCQRKKIDSKRTSKRLHKHPVLREPGGFPRMTSKLFYRKHQPFSAVLFAELKTHHMALGAGKEDQTPATRMKKQQAGGSGGHHTEEGSHGQSPGRTRGLAYRAYTGLKYKFCRMPCQLPTCYALAGKPSLSRFFNIKSVTKQ